MSENKIFSVLFSVDELRKAVKILDKEGIEYKIPAKRRIPHGMINTPFYKRWAGMHSRCNNKTAHNRMAYYYKGIKVCERWKQFINFKEDMYESFCEHVAKHGFPDTTLDRINNNLGYSLENCRWATRDEQKENKGGIFESKPVLYKGVKYESITLLSKHIKIPMTTLRSRLNRTNPNGILELV